jgi:hypothetical protein
MFYITYIKSSLFGQVYIEYARKFMMTRKQNMLDIPGMEE